jgi:hypothetical protein
VLVFSAQGLPAALAMLGVTYLPKPSPLSELWAAITAMMADRGERR